MSKLDILNLEWPNSDRDLHIVTPVLVYLKKKYNISYKSLNIFNGYYYLLKYRPKVLVVSNFSGAKINHQIVKFAFTSGIKVVSFISEGNVKKEVLEQFLWGWNGEKILYVDKLLLWSSRSREIFLSKYPELKDKMVVTGGTGFDRYKLLNFKTKEEFLKENNLGYKKIIGIAAWGFDHFFGTYYESNKDVYLKNLGLEQIKMHRDDLFKLRKIYKELIENNPDKLFILRYHPGNVDFDKNEFYNLENYKNVFISNRDKNRDYKISDLINISDIWIGYETTTALEAWLLGKKTFLINPTKSKFRRENIYKGSPIVKTTFEAQKLIDEFFNEGTMELFEKLNEERIRIIKDVLEYKDGKNYRRAGEEIYKILKKSNQKIKYGYKIYIKIIKQFIKIFLSKTIMKTERPRIESKKDFFEYYYKLYDKVINV